MAELRAVGGEDEDLSFDQQAEILSQQMQVSVGGLSKVLPVRTIKEERSWMDVVLQKAGDLGNSPLDLTPVGYTTLMRIGSEAMLDLVLIYDASNALGGREWVEGHATRREIYAIFRRLIEEHFPFGQDLGGILSRLQGVQGLLALAQLNSVPERSTNGSSRSGNRASRRSKPA